MYLTRILLTSLLFTIFIELILAIILGVRKKLDIVNIILANILTNPLLVIITFYVNIRYGLHMRNIIIIILEIIVFIVEGFIYYKYLDFKKFNPFILSLILNMTSFLLGEVINNLIY